MSHFSPVIMYPLAASCPAMYSPSELLWLQPHVFIQIFWVPGIKLKQNNNSEICSGYMMCKNVGYFVKPKRPV